jgi:hypothetical protein
MVNPKRKTREEEEEAEEAEEGGEASPWLNRRELGSSTVIFPAQDVARGLEPWPIPVINTADSLPYPCFSFIYSPSSILPSSGMADPSGSFI